MEAIRGSDTFGKTVIFAGEKIFWQQALRRVFEKEGWTCFELKEANRDSAEIIRVHNIFVLLYTIKERLAGEPPGQVLQDLLTVLQLAAEYGVHRVYLLTPVSAVRKAEQPQAMCPLAELAESISQKWAEAVPCSLAVLRLPEVYGPEAGADEALTAEWFGALLSEKCVAALPEAPQVRDYIYVDDAVYGIYRAVSREYEGEPLNLVTGQGVTGREFEQYIQRAAGKLPRIDHEKLMEDYDRPLLSRQQAEKELGWQLKYSLDEGLRQTWTAVKTKALIPAATEGAKKIRWQQAVPYIENAAGFLLMILVAWLQNGTPVNPVIRFDMNFIYIGAMGLLYGKQQSLLAMLLASSLLVYTMLRQGGNLIGLLYIPEMLLHVVSYLFTAVLMGYFSDNRAHEREAAHWQVEKATDQYNFLHRLYEENMEVKDRLYRQIVNSDDSMGRLYRIIRKLDSVEPENIFTQAAVVTAQVLNVDDIAVYVVGADHHYLRQKVRIGDLAALQPRSLRVEDHSYLQTILQKKTIYTNRELVKDSPDLAAPIVYQDEVIAVVEIFGMRFEQWSLYQQNLLSITVRLISSSMGRAYQYEREIQERKYLAGTRILQEQEFQKLLEELRTRRQVQGDLPIAMLRVNMAGIDYAGLDERLNRVIRNEDFVGVWESKVYILLPDADAEVTAMVQKRLRQKGLDTMVAEGIL